MRIALVHPYSWPEVRRGGERYLDDLACSMAGAGHRVDVITGTHGPAERGSAAHGDSARHGGSDGCGGDATGDFTIRRRRHLMHPALARRGVSTVDTFGLAALVPLLRQRYDVVHALTPTAALAARVARQPTLYTVLGHPTPDQFGRRPLDRRMAAGAVRCATATVALSGASAHQVQRMFGHRVGILSPGVRLDRFVPDLRPRLGPARILLSADASDGRKGVATALAAMDLVLDHRPDARLVVSGAGDYRWALPGLGDRGARVVAAVDDLGPGGLEDVPERYRAASVTVLPARHEAFGLALLESLACGTPVVCADDGGMPEVVDDAGVGRVVAPDDVVGLAGALEEVIDLAADPRTPARCARHARRWDWERVVGPAHERLYEQLAVEASGG